MLQEMDECVRKGENFAFETTLSGLAYLGRIAKWQVLGYHVEVAPLV